MAGRRRRDLFAPSRWVFVRRSQVIHVARRGPKSIAVGEPRQPLGIYRFDSEEQLEAFQVVLAEQLTERGWLLWTIPHPRSARTAPVPAR